jgi:hypothetical protein
MVLMLRIPADSRLFRDPRFLRDLIGVTGLRYFIFSGPAPVVPLRARVKS